MILFIGMDDTDNKESRGTGRLARHVAACLGWDYEILGVVRHQLLFDPRVPYTKNNSSATIVLGNADHDDAELIFERVKELMLSDFQPGSDPGLCVATGVPSQITRFGQRAKTELVTKEEAYQLAELHGLLLAELGGTGGGVIGALAGVGLSSGGEDGRYVMIGNLRELSGMQPISSVLAAGVDHIQTIDGELVTGGPVLVDKLRPARRGGRAVGYVRWEEDHWQPLKLD